MFKRGVLYFLGLLASVVLPYLVFGDGSLLTSSKAWLAGATSTAHAPSQNLSDSTSPGPEGAFAANWVGGQRGTGGPKLVGAPVTDLAEVLRFDISPQWVIDRWSRVSTVLADSDLEGLRVPLVTGTALNDLAGSLTYYFDKQHAVQRITFQGYSGDERKLAATVAQRYQLKPAPSLHAALYMAKWNGQPKSALRVALAPVVRADSPNTRLEVMLELNRPQLRYGLSPEFKELLERDQQTGRW